jgi:hypothetical protein
VDIDINMGVSYHRDHRSDAHFPPVVSKCVWSCDDDGDSGSYALRMDVPEQTLIGLGEACNCDFVVSECVFLELLRSSDAALPPAFIDEVIDLSAFLVEHNASTAQAHTTATSGLSNQLR